ncbi:MAG TPA: alpha/beta hydrolase [Clostridiaceae bacterium]
MLRLKLKIKNKKRAKIILIVILVAFILVNSVGIYAGNYYYEKICKLEINRNLDMEYYIKSFDYKRFSTLQTLDVNIKSNFGYTLSGTYILNPVATNNTVIVVHGITGSRWEAMKYEDMYLDMGFNVLVYDSRYHGLSGGENITLGFFEKYDLDNVVKYLREASSTCVIGVHGESIGAVTALLQAKLDQNNHNVSFYISDCAYSDLTELLSSKLSGGYMPNSEFFAKVILFYGNLVALKKSDFSIYAVSPIKVIKDISTPIMFIHGSNDTFIPASMSLELYMEKKGERYIYIAPNAEHAMSYFTDKIEYTAKVKEFLTSIKIIKNDGSMIKSLNDK